MSENSHKKPNDQVLRNKGDRRSGTDRRRINPPKYTGIDRRIDPDCRDCCDRREDNEDWSELQSPDIG